MESEICGNDCEGLFVNVLVLQSTADILTCRSSNCCWDILLSNGPMEINRSVTILIHVPFVLFAGVYSKILPYIVFGTISIVAAALSMLLPDTKMLGKLPDLISQTKPIRGYVAIRDSNSN